MLYVFYCRKYFCKYVESIKYLLNSAFLFDGVGGATGKKEIKTIMYIETCVDKTWLCNLCTFATRPIKVLFSYFKKTAQLVSFLRPCTFLQPEACREHVR